MGDIAMAMQDDTMEADDFNGLGFIQAKTLPGRILNEDEFPEVVAHIRDMYANGKQFFTKETMRNAVEVFDSFASGNRQDNIVRIVGLDSVPVEFQLETGELCWLPWADRSDNPDIERINGKPLLDYRSIEHLTRQDLFHGTTAYLPFVVYHEMEFRSKATGAVVVSPDLIPRAEVEEAFRQAQLEWRASQHFFRLQSILEENAAVIPRNIQKIVAFACSSMSVRDDIQQNSAAQHASALYLQEFFSTREARSITCFAQDPQYTHIDKSVLEDAGMTVVEDPRGFIEVDETSVVISVSPDIPIRQIVADIARPALLLWNRVTMAATTEKDMMRTDPESSRVQEMIRADYIEVDLPFDKGFHNIPLYIRKNNNTTQRLQ